MVPGIYEGGSLVEGLGSFKVTINKSSRVIGAPVETGQMSFDNKVIDPTKAVVSGVIVIDAQGKYKSTLAKLEKMFRNRDYTFYAVSDGATSVSGMMLTGFPTIRSVEQYDWISVELVFTEAMLIQKGNSTPLSGDDSTMRNIGYVPGTPRTDGSFGNLVAR